MDKKSTYLQSNFASSFTTDHQVIRLLTINNYNIKLQILQHIQIHAIAQEPGSSLI